MGKEQIPATTAIRFLNDRQVPFTGHFYDYQERGGTRVSAQELGVDEYIVIKTLVFETAEKKPFIVLMHGTYEVSTKNLARDLNTKTVSPCSPEKALRLTGYQVGGLSPFGTKTFLPVLAEASIVELPKILINGGKRGFLVEIDPRDLQRTLEIKLVSVAVKNEKIDSHRSKGSS